MHTREVCNRQSAPTTNTGEPATYASGVSADNQRLQQTRTGEPATYIGMVSLQQIPVSAQQALASQPAADTYTCEPATDTTEHAAALTATTRPV